MYNFLYKIVQKNEPGFLLKDVMAFLPLWACCFGPVNKHASNAEVENHFSIMKAAKKSWKRYSEGEFLEQRFKDVKNEIVVIVRGLIILI